MATENQDMDTSEDGAQVVKIYRCHFCSQYIAAADQVIYTHVQLHIEYMGRDEDGGYRCPIQICQTQANTPHVLTSHMLKNHATKRKAKTSSTSYQKAIRFGIRTKEKLIKMTEGQNLDDENILQPRRPPLDNGPQGRNRRGAVRV